MKKVAILIGHRSQKQGAYSEWMGTTEYLYMKKVAEHLKDVADIYERQNTPFISEGARIRNVVDSINKRDYSIVISLHFNSFHDSRANGATALYYITNGKMKQLGSYFVDLVKQRFGVKTRELISINSKQQRGGTFIINSKAPALLLEPFFGSNPTDSAYFFQGEEKFADLIKDLICDYL